MLYGHGLPGLAVVTKREREARGLAISANLGSLWIDHLNNDDRKTCGGRRCRFWTTSAIGYFGSILLVLASGFIFVRACETPIPRNQARHFLGIPLIFLTHIYHELSSFSLAAIVFASWLFYRRNLRNRVAVSYTAASGFGFLVHISAPGIWSRTSNFEEQRTVPFWDRLKLGSDLYVEMAWPALLLIVAIMVLLVGKKHWAAALSLLSVSLLVVVSLAREDMPLGRLAENQWSPVLLILLFICGVVWFSGNRGVLGAAPLLMWFAMAGALVIPLMLGIGARGHVPATYLTYAVGVIALARSFRAIHRPIWFSVTALVLVLSTVLVPVSAIQINADMGRNEERWNQVATQINQAQAGTRSVIEIPAEWPHPYLMYGYAFDSRYDDVIRQYYDLPSHVQFRK